MKRGFILSLVVVSVLAGTFVMQESTAEEQAKTYFEWLYDGAVSSGGCLKIEGTIETQIIDAREVEVCKYRDKIFRIVNVQTLCGEAITNWIDPETGDSFRFPTTCGHPQICDEPGGMGYGIYGKPAEFSQHLNSASKSGIYFGELSWFSAGYHGNICYATISLEYLEDENIIQLVSEGIWEHANMTVGIPPQLHTKELEVLIDGEQVDFSAKKHFKENTLVRTNSVISFNLEKSNRPQTIQILPHKVIDPYKVNVPDKNIEQYKAIDIPDWLKNNARWWAHGIISDEDFIQGVQFLISKKIIAMSANTTSPEQIASLILPDWEKTSGWWEDEIQELTIKNHSLEDEELFDIANKLLSLESDLLNQQATKLLLKNRMEKIQDIISELEDRGYFSQISLGMDEEPLRIVLDYLPQGKDPRVMQLREDSKLQISWQTGHVWINGTKQFVKSLIPITLEQSPDKDRKKQYFSSQVSLPSVTSKIDDDMDQAIEYAGEEINVFIYLTEQVKLLEDEEEGMWFTPDEIREKRLAMIEKQKKIQEGLINYLTENGATELRSAYGNLHGIYVKIPVSILDELAEREDVYFIRQQVLARQAGS